MRRTRRRDDPPTSFARHDAKALDEMLDRAMTLVRSWSDDSVHGRNLVFPRTTGNEAMKSLAEPLPRRGSGGAAILRRIERRLLPLMRDNGSPRFFGYVMSPPSAPGVVADLITSALDQNVTAWRSAPGATEIERLVVDWLRRIAGMPAGAGGILTSGGSMATFTALAAARARHAPDVTRAAGLGRLGRSLMTIYVSDEAHMSVARAAVLLGLGSDAVRIVPSDTSFRMDTKALEERILDDERRRHRPFCVVASAGTVNTGAVDPIGRIARIARRRGLWMHVDAAYGGPLRLSAKHRRLVAGLGKADSIAMDPHKWLYAPLDVGCVLFRDPDGAREAFPTEGEYARVLEGEDRESHIFFDSSPELSRRFRALKVWMILKYHGTDRIGRRIERDVSLARALGRLVARHPETELLAPVETGIVCLRYRPPGRAIAGVILDRLNHRTLTSLQAAGKVYLSNARIRGRFALRACLINFRTRRSDLDVVIEEVVRHGRAATHALGISR